jgi:hypothetical protein
MDATMLLCDAAQESQGKLHILGAGWSHLHAPSPMALAIKLTVPWDQTNQPFGVRAKLVTNDGEPVDPSGGEAGPVEVTGEFEVGRPPGIKPGSSINLPFAWSFSPLALEPGGYVWELEVNGSVLAREAFTVTAEQP